MNNETTVCRVAEATLQIFFTIYLDRRGIYVYDIDRKEE